MNSIYNVFPKALLDGAISLKQFGILDLAWKSEDVFQIIEILKSIKEPILGGDVYRFEEDKLFQTYDSWYINNTGSHDYYLASYEVTLSYIEKYESMNDGHYVYSIITPVMKQWAACLRRTEL